MGFKGVINENTIRNIIINGKINVTHTGGHKSPLWDIEDTIVNILIQMARIRCCLNPSTALSLINSVIEGTDTKKN